MMGLQDLLLLAVLNTGICLCLPKMLSVFGSINTRRSQKLSTKPTLQEQPELAQPNAYPELASLAR
ncbi:MAG TPA: hypothetical protein V6D33_05250 [Cyanophyceae cyanobacterium]